MEWRNSFSANVLRAQCGQLAVVLGVAPAGELFDLSFADVLDEDLGTGYQREFDSRHSREFRDYITGGADATTIPLTFNLRGSPGRGWLLRDSAPPLCSLEIRRPSGRWRSVLSRVDCQHRLGTMRGSDVPLTFQCYLGLTPAQEMSIFNIINSKAKGLSPSLLDYHSTKLVPNLDAVEPALYIAKKLHEDRGSVFFGRVKLGGAGNQGTTRRVTLRGLKSGIEILLRRSPLGRADIPIDKKYAIVRAYWEAVSHTWPSAWKAARAHLLTKGVGITALSQLAVDALTSVLTHEQTPTVTTFTEFLAPLANVDWTNSGTFRGFGGRTGAGQVHGILQAQLFNPALQTAVREAATPCG